MMFECDLLSWYNRITEKWRLKTAADAAKKAALTVLTAAMLEEGPGKNRLEEHGGLGWHPVSPMLGHPSIRSS